jgi:hypothetical protein
MVKHGHPFDVADPNQIVSLLNVTSELDRHTFEQFFVAAAVEVSWNYHPVLNTTIMRPPPKKK